MRGLLTFSEYIHRLGVDSEDIAAKLLWKRLCQHGESVLGVVIESDYSCRLPMGMLLRLSPEELRGTPAITQRMLDLYKTLHTGLHGRRRAIEPATVQEDTRRECGCSGEMSRQGLIDCTRWSAITAGTVWFSLCRWAKVDPGGAPTTNEIKDFCVAVEAGKVKCIGSTKAPAIARWARHLKR